MPFGFFGKRRSQAGIATEALSDLVRAPHRPIPCVFILADMGVYPIVSLAEARTARDAAKKLLFFRPERIHGLRARITRQGREKSRKKRWTLIGFQITNTSRLRMAERAIRPLSAG
jgi:hypothetical protein